MLKKLLLIGITCSSACLGARAQQPTLDQSKLAEAQRKIDSLMKDPKLKALMNKNNSVGATTNTPGMPSNLSQLMSNPMALVQKPDTAFLSGLSMPAKNVKGIASIPAQPMNRTQVVAFLANMKKKIYGAMQAMGEQPVTMAGYDAESIDKASVLAWISGNKDIALQLALAAANQDPDNCSAINNLGGILTMCGFPYEAVPILDFIRQQDPSNSTINNNIGQAYILMGDGSKAIIYLQQAIGTSPDHPQANFALACLAYTSGDKSKAATYCENAIRGGFISNAWVMLKSIKPDARMMDLIRHRYKQQDYFNTHKFPLLPQCKLVKDVRALTVQYREYDNMLRAMNTANNRAYEAESKFVEKNLANDVMAKVHQQKNPFRPFGPFALTVVGDLGEDLQDRIRKLTRVDSEYYRAIKQLRDEHDAEMNVAMKPFAERADKAGEGNPDMELESDQCKAANAVHNAYLPKFAALTEERQNTWIHQTKDYYNDYVYWAYLASMDDHSYKKMFYSVKSQWLAMIMKLNRTELLSCHIPVTYSNNEADSLEVVEGKCPLSAKIKVGMEKDESERKDEDDKVEGFADFDISCEEYKVTFDLPGAKLSVKQSAAGSTTVTLGASLEEKTNKNKLSGKLLPASIGGTVATYITFGGSLPADWGMKYDAEVNLPGWLGGKNSAGWSFGINSGLEFHGDGKIVNYVSDWAVQNIFGMDPPDKQINKNIKMFDVNSKSH